jgi:hypothetical protein
MWLSVESGMKEKINLLSGSKGGGGSPPPPTVTPDNLRSKDTLEIVLGISEGPIQGLVDGAKSFFIGDTQLQNQNNEYNFRTFKLNFFPGTDDADPIVTTLGGTTSNHSVNLTLAQDVPVVRQTTTGQIDFFEVRLAIARLLKSNNSGTFNASLTFRIEYKPLSDTEWTKVYGEDITISGKTSSTYVKEIRQEVERIDEPYEIRVTKLSSENTTSYFADVNWESYQQVVATQSAYDYTAAIHLVGEASDQFSSIPAFKGVYDGLLIKVPTNYDTTTRIYSGIWDGSFKVAWTNNPAWILYDYVMNDTYGMRSYYADINLDKYDVYEAAQWCDEMVPDGKGGTQPRYTFNAYITEPRSGRELAKYIAGVFNSTFFDDLNGKAYLRVDKDDQATHLFGIENVLDEGFEYSYVDISTRYNDITVTFNNPDLNWAVDRRRVYDQDLIDKNGRIPLDFVAVGCTDEHEAIRRAQHKLLTSNTETCMLNFTTNRLGQFVNVFDTILIADEDMGYSISGRVKSVAQDGLSVELRDAVYIEAGVEYKLQLTLNDGSILSVDLASGHPSGLVYELELAGALVPADIPDKTIFSLQNSTTVGLPRPFRVLSVTEQDGQPDRYQISCININRNKWDDADNVTNSGTVDYSVLPDPFDPPGPTAVGFEERYIKDLKQYQIVVSPTFPRDTYKYYANDHSFEVWSRESGTSDAFVKRDLKFGDTLIDHPAGTYDFRILGKSYLGITSRLEASPNYVFEVTNPADPPADVEWIKINDREVYWGYENAPSDFAGFRVRYHNQAGRTTWDDAARPHEGLVSNTSFYTNLIPPTAAVIMVKAVDDFGNESTNAAVIYRSAGDVTLRNVVEEFDFHTAFSGTKENCTVQSDELRADDTGGQMYSDNPSGPMYDGGDFYESSFNSMTYYPTFVSTEEGTLTIDIDADHNGYEIHIKETGNNPWEQVSAGQELPAGDYTLRAKVFGGPIRGIIREMSAIIDVEDIEETLSDIVIPASTTALAPTKTFSTIKTVSVIIQNDGSSTAVSYRLVSKTPTGPEIELLDSSGAVTSGLVDVIIKGY